MHNNGIMRRIRALGLLITFLFPIVVLAGDVINVLRVIDGDTFVDSRGIKYRLVGIDTPETKDPRKPVETFGEEAYTMTKQLIEGRDVIINRDSKADKIDKYGRQLVIVNVNDVDLNASLVLMGLAKVETRFPISEEYLNLLSANESYAKQKHSGIWSEGQIESNNQECYESSIVSPSPFLGNNGEIFKLSDGSIWEVKYEYSYMYAYSPTVIICPRQGKIIVGKKSLNVELVSRPKSAVTSTNGQAGQWIVFEETSLPGSISGTVQQGRVFKTASGNVYEVTELTLQLVLELYPKVTVLRRGNTYKLIVEGFDKPLVCKKLN
jgi:endonuclease YncB( thermonuclease family)